MAGLGSGFDSDDVISEINVTPLVDIFLVLLIIFMVTSSIMVRAQAINVDLPTAASAGEELPESVSFVLDDQGNLTMDGALIELSEVREALEPRVAENPELRALIAASRRLDYGIVMDLIDEVRLARVAGFSLNVEREAVEPTP